MGLLKNAYVCPHGINHDEAYISIHNYQVNVAKKLIHVVLTFHADGKAKDNGYKPIHVEEYKMADEDFDNIVEDNSSVLLSEIYNTLTDKERTDNTLYHATINVFEQMLKENSELELNEGDEVSRSIAKEASLIEDEDFESVNEK